MIAQTSIQAYDREGMNSLRTDVYNLIHECNMLSNRDIANILHREPSTISGRTNELMEDGFIVPWDTKKDPITGRKVQVWEAIA